jgi:FRG domain
MNPIDTLASSGDCFHGTVEVNTWEELKGRVNTIRRSFSANPEAQKARLLFRGQANHRWTLATTLERHGRIAEIDCVDYFRIADSVRAEVQAHTGLFEFPSIEEIEVSFREVYEFATLPLPALDYLVQLRHHGFPSPLLDWTQDLYTAAFFAFSEVSESEASSIYIFCEMPIGRKEIWREQPTVIGLPHEVSSRVRHNAQNSEYTYCFSLYGEHDWWSFSPHELVLKLEPRGQDCLMQFVIPASERAKILGKLAHEGITREGLLPPSELDLPMERL